MTRRSTDRNQIVYQCHTCHFVLIRKREDPPPSYCPNCAINHQRGKMVTVWDSRVSGTEPNAHTKR